MNKSLVLAVGVCTVFLSVAALAGPTQDQMAPRPGDLSQKASDRVTREVRHELVMLPYYGVFDNLAYSVSPDGTVTLLGQVARPTLKSDAESAVKRIEGVEKVVNNIEVLPTSIAAERLVFQFFLGTGCREREVMFATWKDVDLTAGTFTVKAKPAMGFKPKDSEERTIPIPSSLVRDLKALKTTSKTNLIFPNGQGNANGHLLPGRGQS